MIDSSPAPSDISTMNGPCPDMDELNQFLSSAVGGNDDDHDPATPTVATINTQGSIVDFPNHDNIVPISGEFEGPFIPSDYNAYGDGSLNW